MKSAKNLCNNVVKTNKISNFQKLHRKSLLIIRQLKYKQTFLTNKGLLTSDSISLTQENEAITN